MLKVDTSPPLTKPWTKVQALTNFIHLKSLSAPGGPNHQNATSTVSQTNNKHVPHPQRNIQSQIKSDRLKIFIGTWNMKGRLIELEPFLNTLQPSGTTTNNGPATGNASQSDSNKVLVDQDLGGVSPFLDSSSLHPYHLLVIGTQECERDISESLFYPSKEVWEKKLSDYLGERYKLLRCETLAGVHLAVFAWKPVTSYVKNVHSAGIKTGWANMVGNKGAVAVSLDFGSQSFVFINCHLRAHQTKLAERNANIHRILHELQIKGGKAPQTQSSGTMLRIPSLKNIARYPKSTKSSSKSSKSTKSSKSSKSSKSVKSAKSTKRKESSEKVEVTNEDVPSANVESARKKEKAALNTKTSRKYTNDRPPSSKTPKSATPKPSKSTPATKALTNGTKSNKTASTNSDSLNSGRKKKDNDSGDTSPGITPSSTAAEGQHSVMEQFDHCFIFGDTNYRLNLTSRPFVLDAIQKQDFKTLLQHDQLTLERQQRTTPLATFKEHPINFIPTYKFDTLETMPTTATTAESSASSSSLPVSSAVYSKTGQPSPASSSAPQTPLTTTTASSSSSSSQSFVITPTDSLHSSGSISIRYDSSPKQRIPSWTDRILWHDKEQQQQTSSSSDDRGTGPSTMLSTSGPTMTSIATANTSTPQHSKSKLNLKWISALTRKNKTNGLERSIVDRPVDKSTICYHYNTVMDPRLMGASDHLPVVGIFGVWFDDWGSGTSIKRTRSIKSIKKKVPLWKKWI